MRLFRKQKPDHMPPRVRQRPDADNVSSRPAQAFSYYSRSTPQTPDNQTYGDNIGRGQPSPQERQNTRTFSRKLLENRLVIGLVATSSLALVIYMLALGGAPKIVTLTSSGSTYFLEDTKIYQQTAEDATGASIINSNKLTYDTNKITSEIKNNHSELEAVTIGLPFIGRSPTIYIKPYTPSFILTTNDSKAFLMDVNGRALISASQISDPGELSVPTLQDKSGARVTLGTQAVPSSIIAFTQTVTRVLDAKKITYTSLVLPAAASELDVYIGGRPYYVKFNLQDAALPQIGTFLSTKQRLENEQVTPSQYIDVRVAERAYYK